MVFDSSKILFQYGAESGGLIPPFLDYDPTTLYRHRDIVTSPVHSGIKSVRLWLEREATSGDSAATGLFYPIPTTVAELYFSVWAYFPSGQLLEPGNGWALGAIRYWEVWDSFKSSFQGDVLFQNLDPYSQVTWGGLFWYVENTIKQKTVIGADS